MSTTIAGWKDKILFTPGPLTTSRTVKQALLRDLGSRDFEFIRLIRERVRVELQRVVKRRSGRRPLVVPVVMEV